MPSISRNKPIPYPKSHAAQIESVKQFQEKESLIAALKLIALGEKERVQGKGISVAESRAQLAAARQRRR